MVAQIDDEAFSQLLNRHPHLWRPLTLEMSRRLDERKKFHREPNHKAILFIGSSTEQLPIAKALAEAILNELAAVTLWSRDVFGPSSFPVDDLLAQSKIVDFAILIAGHDDQITSRGNLSYSPRDNVIFELGLFMGTLSRSRTFMLIPRNGQVKIPTDLLGLNCLQFEPPPSKPEDAIGTTVRDLLAIIANRGPK